MKRTKSKVLGFSLLELLIVIAVLGALTTFAMFTYPASQRRARDTQRMNDLKQYQAAILNYGNRNNGVYPTGSADLTDICDNELGLDSCPDNSEAGQSYQYQGSDDGTEYVIWSSLENEADDWAACSNGLVGSRSTLASDCVFPTAIPTPGFSWRSVATEPLDENCTTRCANSGLSCSPSCVHFTGGHAVRCYIPPPVNVTARSPDCGRTFENLGCPSHSSVYCCCGT